MAARKYALQRRAGGLFGEANIRWFILDAHGVLRSQPKPLYAVYAPILTGNGVASVRRDLESAKQVWSRQEGYPGDPGYREFYRDAGFDLEFEYISSRTWPRRSIAVLPV